MAAGFRYLSWVVARKRFDLDGTAIRLVSWQPFCVLLRIRLKQSPPRPLPLA
jgi:hypothetical protein